MSHILTMFFKPSENLTSSDITSITNVTESIPEEWIKEESETLKSGSFILISNRSDDYMEENLLQRRRYYTNRDGNLVVNVEYFY